MNLFLLCLLYLSQESYTKFANVTDNAILLWSLKTGQAHKHISYILS